MVKNDKNWEETKSGGGLYWKWVEYERVDGGGINKYKVEWTPTAACKRRWKKAGEGTPKKHTQYFRKKPR